MFSLKITTSLLFIVLLFSGCSESPEQQRLRQYLSSINAQATAVPPSSNPVQLQNFSATSTQGASHAIVGGTPREVKEGFCGDGIINGNNEDCDQGAIQNTACRDYNGLSGVVRCKPDCLYDISDCITPAVDKRLGGAAESCKCNCNTTSCRGGCSGTGSVGQSVCLFECDNDCVCRCEEKLEAHIENCEFRCACIIDGGGNPACECSLNSCDILTTISKNIATIIGR